MDKQVLPEQVDCQEVKESKDSPVKQVLAEVLEKEDPQEM